MLQLFLTPQLSHSFPKLSACIFADKYCKLLCILLVKSLKYRDNYVYLLL